jgi:hypothetical protein
MHCAGCVSPRRLLFVEVRCSAKLSYRVALLNEHFCICCPSVSVRSRGREAFMRLAVCPRNGPPARCLHASYARAHSQGIPHSTVVQGPGDGSDAAIPRGRRCARCFRPLHPLGVVWSPQRNPLARMSVPWKGIDRRLRKLEPVRPRKRVQFICAVLLRGKPYSPKSHSPVKSDSQGPAPEAWRGVREPPFPESAAGRDLRTCRHDLLNTIHQLYAFL